MNARTPAKGNFLTGWWSRSRHRRRMEEHRRATASWDAEHARIEGYLSVVRDCRNKGLITVLIPHETGIRLEHGEVAVADISGALLVETTRQPTRYDGGYGGVSFPLIGPLRLEGGRQRGRLVPGDESLEVIDEGRVVLTTRRAIFVGGLRASEWRHDNLLTVVHDPDGMTLLIVNDRRLNSGFAYAPEVAVEVQFRVELALAVHAEQLDRLQASLQAEIARHRQLRPVEPVPASPTVTDVLDGADR